MFFFYDHRKIGFNKRVNTSSLYAHYFVSLGTKK